MTLNHHQRTVLAACPPDRPFKAREAGCGQEYTLGVFVRDGLARREPATAVWGGARLQFQYRLTEAGRDRQREVLP